MKQKQIRVVGKMDNTIDHSYESRNRISDGKYCCPTIQCGGGTNPMVIKRWKNR